MTTTSSPTRQVGYDILRTAACVMVVVLHASAQMWYTTPVTEPDWVALHVWNTVTRAAVAIFFMLSGALLLNAPSPGRSLWTRRIPRLAVAYVAWSLLYGIDSMNLSGLLADPLGLINAALVGKFHLWFMPTMIGVYLLLPALYAIAHYEGGRALRPYLWVFGLFGILSGTVAALEGLLPWAVSNAFSKVVPELCKCCGYFLLGYALTRVKVERLHRGLLLGIFAAAVALTALVGVLQSRRVGVPVALLHDNFALPTAIEAVCLFLAARKCRLDPASRTARLFSGLSACTLGVYLLHPFVLDQLQKLGFEATTLPAWIGVPVLALVVGLICFAVTALLRRIPVLGKWLV